MRSLIQLYALAVCFCALMCLVIALGIGLYDLVRIAVPDFTLSQSYYVTNDQYLLYNPEKKGLPVDELTRQREELHQQSLVGERKGGGQSLVFAAIIVGIDIVVYAIHWRIARQADSLGIAKPRPTETIAA